MAEKGKGNLALIFGGGDDAASGEPSGDATPTDTDVTELGEMPDGDEPEAPPPDFAVNAAEAFPELAGDDARLDALYRTIKSCHPGL